MKEILWYNQFFNYATGVLCDNSIVAEITNSIFWNTGPLDFTSCTIIYSCVDKEIAGTGNVNIYPKR